MPTTSEAQLAANRANAQLSTGPVTEAGRAAIAQNNFRHGLASAFVVLPSEDHAAYDDNLLNLTVEFSPATETEEILVTAMAQHHWLNQRALRLQQSVLEPAMESGTAPDTKQLSLYIRYQTTHERAYHKSLTQLLRLRNDRRRSEIGFESQKARNELHQVKLAAETARAETHKAKQQEAIRAKEQKEELHQMKLRQADARASNAEFENYLQQTMEAPIPGNARFDFDQIHRVLMSAVHVANAEESAKQQHRAA